MQTRNIFPAPPEVKLKEDSTWVEQIRKYELITPLFGGGVEPGEADPVTVVRTSSIRGQLRFWWRATRGGQYSSIEELKKAEDRLWGAAGSGTPTASQVQVAITLDKKGDLDKPFDVVKNKYGNPEAKYRPASNIPAYIAFPLQPERDSVKKDMDLPEVRVGVAFTLQIRYPSASAIDIEAALWAWETFGGIGARTRRGFGALRCISINGNANTNMPDATDAETVQRWISVNLSRYLAGTDWPDNVPHLTTQMLLQSTPPQQNPIETWRQLIDRLRDFRQQRNPGTQPNRPGRSRWPEADEIRRITRKALPRHAQPITTLQKFPRAAFGLPLIIAFKRDEQALRGTPGDPPGSNTIKGLLTDGTILERWASPLILRPIATRAGYVGLAAVLDGTRLPKLILDTGGSNQVSVSAVLNASEAAQITRANGDLLLDHETDVLRAFLNTLKGIVR